MKNQIRIAGYFNEYGYIICKIDDHAQIVDQIYSAGNNKFDSADSQILPLNHSQALPLRTIKSYCKQTAQEIAKENRLAFAFIEYDEDSFCARNEAIQNIQNSLRRNNN